MRVKHTAIVQLNGHVIERPRETDNRDLAAMAEFYKARAEALESELESLRGDLARAGSELASLRDFLLERLVEVRGDSLGTC